MKDRYNREIQVGDYLAYPGYLSSSCWFNVGRVTEVNGSYVKLHIVVSSTYHRTGRDTRIYRVGRAVVLPGFDPTLFQDKT